MTENCKAKNGALAACLLFFFCRLAVRTASFAHSAVASDVLYMDGSLPDIFLGIRSLATWLSVCVVILSLSLLSGRPADKPTVGVAWGLTAICFADAAAVFLGDLFSGSFQDTFLIWLGAAVVAGTFLVDACFVWLVYCIARKAASPEKSILWASGLHMIGRLAMETVYLIQFLVEVDFSPYRNEILSILRSYGSIVLWQGMALWLMGILACRLWRRSTQRNDRP